MNPKTELEKRRLVCGPVTVGAEGVCRRKLAEKYNSLLDRLTHEVHPEYVKPEPPKGYEFDADGNLVNTAERLQREKEETLKTVLKGADSDGKGTKPGFQEGLLMGNSKLLQDPTGKVKGHEGKSGQGNQPKKK